MGRARTKIIPSTSDLQWVTKADQTMRRLLCFYQNSVHISRRSDTRALSFLQRKDNSKFGNVVPLGTAIPISVPGLLNKDRSLFWSAAGSHFRMDFSDSLGLTNPFKRQLLWTMIHMNCCSCGILLCLQFSWLLIEYLLLQPRSALAGVFKLVRERHLQCSLLIRPGMGLMLVHYPFYETDPSTSELLHTLWYCDPCGHRLAVYE